jgi:hypothetical protein
MDTGDSTYAKSLAAHFNRPRVSGLFADLDPTAGGQVSWKQLGDRVAVTWQDVPEFGFRSPNSFQVELFQDGRIRLTYLALAARYGLAGLSAGQGLPGGFEESDFTAWPACPVALLSSPPRLEVRRAGATLMLVWPAAGTGLVLEASDSLSPALWRQIPTALVPDGGQYQVPVSVTATSTFYRLRPAGP